MEKPRPYIVYKEITENEKHTVILYRFFAAGEDQQVPVESKVLDLKDSKSKAEWTIEYLTLLMARRLYRRLLAADYHITYDPEEKVVELFSSKISD